MVSSVTSSSSQLPLLAIWESCLTACYVIMKSQVSKLCQAAYYRLHIIHSKGDCLTHHATELVVHFLVISRLDYGNSLLYGLPDQLLDKLQRVQNAAARVMVKASRYHHVTQIVETLRWLPVLYRIQYKTLLTT